MKSTLILALAVSLFGGYAVNASVLGEKWCRLTAEDMTSVLKKYYISGQGRMSGSIFDAEIKNDSLTYAVTEIEIEVSGTYDKDRTFKRTATASVFLEPTESERVFFMVDDALSFSRVKVEKWKILRIMACSWD